MSVFKYKITWVNISDRLIGFVNFLLSDPEGGKFFFLI